MRKKLLALTLIALLLLPGGSAEPSEPVDGTLRVYLLSLGNIASIDFTLDGVYTVNGSSGFRLDKGTTFTLALVNGSIYLLSGGLTIQMGESFQLTRRQKRRGRNQRRIPEQNRAGYALLRRFYHPRRRQRLRNHPHHRH